MSASSPEAASTTDALDVGDGKATPDFRPFVPPWERPPELTLSAVGLGTILGILFGASSLYLSLKVGMTVSASIPVAVLSIALFRALGKGSGRVLENNIVQTAGSAGRIHRLRRRRDDAGAHDPRLRPRPGALPDRRRADHAGHARGLPRRAPRHPDDDPRSPRSSCEQHGKLLYPEGTACAKVLVAGEAGGASARPVLWGLGLAFVYQTLMQGLKLWQDSAGVRGHPRPPRRIRDSASVTLTLLGVGYIIGFRVASIMVGGGLLASFVLTPIFAMFVADPQLDPAGTRIVATSRRRRPLWGQIRSEYVLYISAEARLRRAG